MEVISMRKKTAKPASRAKYERQNPTISIRVSRQFYEELKDFQALTGKSIGDILREALGKQAPSAQEAFDNGVRVAEDMHKIVFKCSVCGGNEEVFGEVEKKAVALELKRLGWGHSKCLKQKHSR